MTLTDQRGQSITLDRVSKSWGDTVAVDQMDLSVEPGSFTVLLGPSGCGKSTSLRIIAGLEGADTGDINIGGVRVNDLPPARRDIAMVFQSYALFPHLNVAENILFGLKVRRTSKADQRLRLKKTADLLGLSELLARKPAQLSGGQQQRVALGRAIIAEKPICLMDEPLSNLDAKLRNAMRTEIRDLQQEIGFSMIYVTHDQAEAITMADQVVLMREGCVEQSGTPREIYEQPATAFVAGFIGTPAMNLFPATDLGLCESAGPNAGTNTTAAFDTGGVTNNSTANNIDTVTVGVRPEHIRISDGRGIEATVEHVEYMGADVLAECRIGNSKLLARVAGNSSLQVQSKVSLEWPRDQTHFFNSQHGGRMEVPSELVNKLF